MDGQERGVLMATINLHAPIASVLKKFGAYQKVYTEPEGSIPCPCTDNPYHQYSQIWHIQHPEAPNCHQTGRLASDGSEGYFEVQTIWGVVLPNYSASAAQDGHTIAGLTNNWPWIGITQEDVKFNRWISPFNTTFMVKSEMPYYVEGNGDTLTVAIYGLSPVTTDVKIP